MLGNMHAAIAAGFLFASSVSVTAAPMWTTVGSGGFDNGYASSITYDVNAARGSANDRGNAQNALGAADTSFFEIGFGSYIDLTFGTLFDTSVSVFEITFGNVLSWPESAGIFVGDGIDFQLIASIDNTDAQGGGVFPISLVGTFDTVRIKDTSPTRGLSTGGFDVDAVRVTPVPLPAALPLLGAGLAVLGFVGWRRRQAA
ncbi:MAG: VPLPA-CTERM sorting domain-containing protein [Roseibium sp.]|uniref:VPLPA-CTERM sorting domain-containing protein n=1 Tax=Roseibium sp. TaxID=1936156 RepID=UPI003D9C3C03